MTFGKATDLVNLIKREIEQHGDDLEIAFYVDEEIAVTANDSVIGAIKIDDVESVERTIPARLYLAFDTRMEEKNNPKVKITFGHEYDYRESEFVEDIYDTENEIFFDFEQPYENDYEQECEQMMLDEELEIGKSAIYTGGKISCGVKTPGVPELTVKKTIVGILLFVIIVFGIAYCNSETPTSNAVNDTQAQDLANFGQAQDYVFIRGGKFPEPDGTSRYEIVIVSPTANTFTQRAHTAMKAAR